MNRFLKKLLNLIFSRVMALAVAIFLQLIVLFSMFNWLGNYTVYMYALLVFTSFLTIIVIVNNETDSLVKIGWIIPIATVPVFGVLFYTYVQYQPATALLRRRYKKIGKYISSSINKDDKIMDNIKKTLPQLYNLSHYIYSNSGFPIYDNTYIKYFELGELKFARMLEELKKAEKFIFLEYFIIEEGYMWSSILKILEEKAKQGVDVRVIYDGTCSILHLPYGYLKKFENTKIKFKIFSPIRPVLTTIQNNRDHRKILVIDGNTAFTGGVNISDEYINRIQVYGHWKDTALMIKGKAVNSFTAMFLQTWNITNKEIDDISQFMCTTENTSPGYIIPYGDNPFANEHLGIHIYMDMINNARNYVHICSPYLVPNEALLESLTYASKRGVEVRIILPGIQDKAYCRALAYRYYPQLMKSGVEIYHYSPGFIHAKSIVCDDRNAMVGTQNLDFRSLFLHFECGAFFCETDTVSDVENDFNNTLDKCILITEDYLKRIGLPTRIAGSLLRLAAPLL